MKPPIYFAAPSDTPKITGDFSSSAANRIACVNSKLLMLNCPTAYPSFSLFPAFLSSKLKPLKWTSSICFYSPYYLCFLFFKRRYQSPEKIYTYAILLTELYNSFKWYLPLFFYIITKTGDVFHCLLFQLISGDYSQNLLVQIHRMA